ncbi:g7004 [Coccomyxa elongata]
MVGHEIQGLDLPVATSGFEEWAGVIGDALAYGGNSKEDTLQALKGFQAVVMEHLKKQGDMFQDAKNGDFTDIIKKVLTPKMDIQAPVFFSNTPGVIQSSAAAVRFSFTGAGYQPCAVAVTPTAVAVAPVGVFIEPQALFVAPFGVNVQAFGVNISPTAIVIAPYDTTVAGQGLNIAPALIAVAPIKTVINPVGPLAVGGSLIAATLPAIPDPPPAGPGPVLPDGGSFISKLLPPGAAEAIAKALPNIPVDPLEGAKEFFQKGAQELVQKAMPKLPQLPAEPLQNAVSFVQKLLPGLPDLQF